MLRKVGILLKVRCIGGEMGQVESVLSALNQISPLAAVIYILQTFINQKPIVCIMVTSNHDNMSIQLLYKLRTKSVIIQHCVTKVINGIFRLNYRIPSLNDCGVHFINILKTTRFIYKTSIMTKVRITREPYHFISPF